MIKFSHLIYYDKIFSLMILSNKFLYRLKKSNKMQQYADIHHHHKHPGLGHLTRSVSRVTPALSIASLVSQLFSFLVGCRCMISREFGFVAFFVCVRASSFCIHLSCLVCSLSVVLGVNNLCYLLFH